jgi:hypothetical protein
MMAKHIAPMLRIAAGSLLATLGACADHDSSSDDLLDTEATIAALRSSGAAAQAEAQACFDAFKTCQASAAAGDTACRDQLKACLPERAPRGDRCGDGGSGDGGSAPGDAGVAADASARIGWDKQRGDGGEPERGGDGGARDGDGGGRGGDRGDRGGAGGDRGGRGGDRGDHGGRGPRGCGGFDGPDRDLGGCREQAGSAMQGGMSTDGARAQHQACTAQAFDAILTKLCSKATATCAEPNAPADVCARISSACSALARPDAGP